MTPKTKDHCEMQISEINHWLTEIANCHLGKPGTEIYEIYKATKKAYARVMVSSVVESKRLSKVHSKLTSQNSKNRVPIHYSTKNAFV